MIIRRMDQVDFEQAEWVELVHQPWLPANEVAARASLLLCGSRLHVRMEARETGIRAVETNPLGMVCQDSCLEFFLAPDVKDHRYLNFEWNMNGSLYLGFGGERNSRIRQLIDDPVTMFRYTSATIADGWRIDYSIPEELIRTYFPSFSFGQAMEGNFYKCGDLTDHPHYLAWMHLTSNTPDFHRRQDFGSLSMEE